MEQKQIDTAGRTENFFSRNVKLLTFLICVSIILAPFVIVYINDYIENAREESRPEMTVQELFLVAERGQDLRRGDLSKFEGYCIESDMQGMHYAMYRIPIVHEDKYILSVSFDASLNYVFHLDLINMETREKLDLFTEADELEGFLKLSAN